MKKRRFSLRRGTKTVLNLVLSALVLVLLWGLYGYPLPTAELEFRRLERENLLGRSDIQGVFQDSSGRWIVFGTQEDQVVLNDPFELKFWPRAERGPVLVPVGRYGLSPTEAVFAAVDVPEGTASAVLELSMDGWTAQTAEGGTSFSALEGGYPRNDSLSWAHWERSYRTEGQRLEDGGILFRIAPQDEDPDLSNERLMFWMLNSWYTYQQSNQIRGLNCHMEAVFRDKTGTELGRAVLHTLEGGEPDAP